MNNNNNNNNNNKKKMKKKKKKKKEKRRRRRRKKKKYDNHCQVVRCDHIFVCIRIKLSYIPVYIYYLHCQITYRLTNVFATALQAIYCNKATEYSSSPTHLVLEGKWHEKQ